MPQTLQSRSLFKHYVTSLDAPGVYNGRQHNPHEPYKAWFDDYLLANPTFVGKKVITSPQGEEIEVTYGKSFVEYPEGVSVLDGVYSTGRLIISRQDAIAFNVKRGDEKTASQDFGVPAYSDFPWDRPLAEDEVIKQEGPFMGVKIFSKNELETPDQHEVNQLDRLEAKIDEIHLKLDLIEAKIQTLLQK